MGKSPGFAWNEKPRIHQIIVIILTGAEQSLQGLGNFSYFWVDDGVPRLHGSDTIILRRRRQVGATQGDSSS